MSSSVVVHQRRGSGLHKRQLARCNTMSRFGTKAEPTMIISQNRGRAAARTSTRADVRNLNTSSGADPLSDRLSSPSTEIDLARRERTNVFLIGHVARCDDVIATLGPDLIEQSSFAARARAWHCHLD